jgi:hypothetical protein
MKCWGEESLGLLLKNPVSLKVKFASLSSPLGASLHSVADLLPTKQCGLTMFHLPFRRFAERSSPLGASLHSSDIP